MVARQVKDPVLTLLWCGLDPWPRNFCMPWAWPKKRERGGKKGNLFWKSGNNTMRFRCRAKKH